MTIVIGAFIAVYSALGLMAWWIVHLVRRSGGIWIRRRGDDKLWWHDCPHCSDGAQHLTDGKWGAIPKGLTIADHKNRLFRPPQANVRSCRHCAGMGGFNLPYPVSKEEAENVN